MTRLFDRVRLAVPDIGAAVEEYRVLFGSPGTVEGPVARWALSNTVIELRERPTGLSCVQGLAFNLPRAGPGDSPVENTLGLDLVQCDGQSTEALRQLLLEARPTEYLDGQRGSLSVDHVVLRTDNAQACIELFGDQLGIRLALDQVVAQWGGRMLFFRGGKLTLEVIESEADASRGNYFWGLAYQCDDLPALVARLRASGATVSDIRKGRKPDTRVATLKSHCLGVPTLLIQPMRGSTS